MSEIAVPSFDIRASARPADRSATHFAIAALTVVVISALLAGFVPLAFSIVTVFLFAGPHNWVEFRYFLSRMPARWGPLRVFFLTGIIGVVSLTGAFIAIPVLSRQFDWDGTTLTYAAATWNSALVLWIATLVVLRNRHKVSRAGVAATRSDWRLGMSPSFTCTRSSRCGFWTAKSPATAPPGCALTAAASSPSRWRWWCCGRSSSIRRRSSAMTCSPCASPATPGPMC
jgi:hypothetical protein